MEKNWASAEYREFAEKNRVISSRNFRMKKHGLTGEHYNKLLLEQNGVCAICLGNETIERVKGGYKDLAIDHCHKTGKVRGLLCNKCNYAIGYLKDNPKNAQRAMEYLEKHSQ